MLIGKLIEGQTAKDIVTCSASMPVREAIALLASKRIGALPVIMQDQVAGIFSERDVIYRLADEGELCLGRAVGEVMTAPAITVTRDTTSDEALALMTRRRIRHLPVVESDKLCGFVSIGDLVKARLEQISHEAEAMRDYIRTA
ncbi:CBS domain-containing protein [Porphyrobacter algicida]|uniref:CBS domain-containing protein n=1 Tax=Qipengyuania algicida TaxID=1836209 RepID=A0A845AFP4_9SPHN|nr:CBS domain-containing protein [Qipengyuania algicida]MXP28043.1 CBS domain-containing protein [Qipengyuania algicida]